MIVDSLGAIITPNTYSGTSLKDNVPTALETATVRPSQYMLKPLQEDGESLDTQCKDYDLLQRLHKYDAVTDDQTHHYQAGWGAAVTYYANKA